MSGCRVTDIETGTVVTICGRKFHQNKKKALKVLDERMEEIRQEGVAANKKEHRDYKIKNTETIRTYHFKRMTVKDHRSGKTVSLTKMLDGEIDLKELSNDNRSES